jgi:peptidoglycan/LPS O-acetylase OafA/YrhL
MFNHRAQTVIKFLASYSFTLYASHYTVLYWREKTLGKTSEKTLLFAAGFLLSYVIAIALAYFFEMKHKELRSRVKMAWLTSC